MSTFFFVLVVLLLDSVTDKIDRDGTLASLIIKNLWFFDVQYFYKSPFTSLTYYLNYLLTDLLTYSQTD